MNTIKDCWHGHRPLRQVFWRYHIGIPFALLFAFGLIFGILPDSLKTVFTLTFVAFLLLYQVWALVSVWRCAKNSQRWRTLARFWVVLVAVSIPIRAAINYPYYAEYAAAHHQSASAVSPNPAVSSTLGSREQMTESHWTQVLAALLTPTIALFGLFIAYWQWRTAQKKLKLDLFEKRFAVYDAARTFIVSVTTSGKAKNEEMYKFLSGTREAKWLLNEDIATYFDVQIWQNANELQTLYEVRGGVQVDDGPTTNVQRQAEIKKWFIAQPKVLEEKFSPFLKLAH